MLVDFGGERGRTLAVAKTACLSAVAAIDLHAQHLCFGEIDDRRIDTGVEDHMQRLALEGHVDLDRRLGEVERDHKGRSGLARRRRADEQTREKDKDHARHLSRTGAQDPKIHPHG